MDVVSAAIKTNKYLDMELESMPQTNPLFDECAEELTIAHQRKLLKDIINYATIGDKAHRHLGWVQAVLTMHCIGNCNVYRIINDT